MMKSKSFRLLPDALFVCAAKWREPCLSIAASAALLGGHVTYAYALPEAANPEAHAPTVQYQPVIEGYVRFRPVEPRSWQGVNQDVAPKPRQEKRRSEQQ
jgi:hypothetical protein